MWNELLIFSKWLETTRLSHLMAGGWKWGWPTCETLHFIGLSMLLGCIGVVDLRMLGVAKSMPGAPVHKLVPWAVAGFLINAITGVLFFIGAPHQYIKNVAFLFKMLFIVLAMIVLVKMEKTVFRNPASALRSAAGTPSAGGPVQRTSRTGSQTSAVLEPSLDSEAQFLPANAKLLATLSLVFWTLSITAGRLMAYLGPQTGIK